MAEITQAKLDARLPPTAANKPTTHTRACSAKAKCNGQFVGRSFRTVFPVFFQNRCGHISHSDLGDNPPTCHLEDRSQQQGVSYSQAQVYDRKSHGTVAASKEEEVTPRRPGEFDEAGNKIHHKGLLGHIMHWEHTGMNADE